MRRLFLLWLLFVVSSAAHADQSAITISAVGDIMVGTTYPEDWLPEDEGRSFFRDAAPYIQASDIRFGNFEGTFFSGPPQPDGKAPGPNRYLFKTPEHYVQRLVEAQFNVMSLANNHSRDFGSAGLTSTKETLASAGIQYSAKEGEVASFQIRNVRVALIAADYKPGARNVVIPEPIFDEIIDLKKRYHVVIVTAHVGAEGRGAENTPDLEEIFLGENRGNSISFARRAVDSGADAIIMHGPHVPRGIEIYRSRVIAYSLGNFATARGISVNRNAALAPLLRLQLSSRGEFLRGQVFSFKQVRGSGTLIDPDKKALEMIQRMSWQNFAATAPTFKENGGF